MRLPPRDDCTGCGACFNACPRGAIYMSPDEEGFLQPTIANNLCINCGKCVSVCPILDLTSMRPPNIEKVPYCGMSKDESIWYESSSGGAFSEICFGLKNFTPTVFGAKFDGVANVRHDLAEGVHDIAKFRKSKYVQSEMGNAMAECKTRLDNGRFVIFSGTPCQIAGLRAFLGKEYDSLLTIEFICHGVGSPKVFKDCLSILESRRKKKISKYTFRSKAGVSNVGGYVSCVEYSDGTSELILCDLYNQLFLNQLNLRRSCMENCKFRSEQRFADITVADCRGERDLYPDKPDKNWSVIIANTAKGVRYVEMVRDSADFKPYPIRLLRKTNPLYFGTTPGNPLRGDFFEEYLRKGPSVLPRIAKRMKLREKFLGRRPPLWRRIIGKIWRVIRFKP